MNKLTIKANYKDISTAVQQMEKVLKEWKITSEERIKSILLLEETLVKIADSASDEDKIQLIAKKNYRKVSFNVKYKGKQIELSKVNDTDLDLLGEEYGEEAEAIIRDMILRTSKDYLSMKYTKGVNTINITVHKNEKAMIYDTFIAICLAVLSGIIIRNTLPTDVVNTISTWVYSSLYTIFIRCIQMVLAPMIFFSLASCIANLTDLSSLGRTAVKVISCYLLTTLIAVLVCFGIDYVLQPGVGFDITLPQATSKGITVEETSILHTLLNMVPQNFVGAFVSNDIIQILILGIVVGIAVGETGKYCAPLREAIESIDALVQIVLKYIMRLMPIAVFGAVGSMTCTLDVDCMQTVGKWVLVVILGFIVMQVVYMLLILFFTGLNPTVFLKKFTSAQITSLSTASSAATMPVTMNCCRKCGISPRLFNFSIPLGTTINMDGCAVVFTITGLFLAELYGIQMDASVMTTFIFTVLMLSIATPPVPGVAMACIVIVLDAIGVPLEASTLIVGAIPFFDITTTANNIFGDGTVTLIVAKSENMLDKQQYYAE